MKKQQIEAVVMAWLSPIKSGAQRCFQSTREAVLSEAGFEKVFRTQNWVR